MNKISNINLFQNNIIFLENLHYDNPVLYYNIRYHNLNVIYINNLQVNFLIYPNNSIFIYQKNIITEEIAHQLILFIKNYYIIIKTNQIMTSALKLLKNHFNIIEETLSNYLPKKTNKKTYNMVSTPNFEWAKMLINRETNIESYYYKIASTSFNNFIFLFSRFIDRIIRLKYVASNTLLDKKLSVFSNIITLEDIEFYNKFIKLSS